MAQNAQCELGANLATLWLHYRVQSVLSPVSVRTRYSNLAPQLPDQVEHLAPLQQQLVPPAADLVPQHGGADRREQQAADAIGDVRLLQVLGLPLDLDTEVEGADGVEIDVGEIGDHVGMGAIEMLGLQPRLVDAAGHLAQHRPVVGELALQVEHAEHVAQQVGVFRGPDVGQNTLEAVDAEVQGVELAKHREGGGRVLLEQAVDAGGEIPGLAGARGGDGFDQSARLENTGEGDGLVPGGAGEQHDQVSVRLKVCSMTPPPRQTSSR